MQLPPGVTQKHGRYYVVRRNKWQPLTRIDEGEVALLEAYYELTKADPHNMAGVLLSFVKHGMGKLSAPTQKDYRRIVVTRLIPFCGHMARGTLRPSHVAQYLARREEEGAAVAGNRERACLSSACNYGMRKGWLEANPCYGVRRNKETPSKVYVETPELVETYDRAHAALQILLNGAYLSGMRQTELIELTRPQLVWEGDRIVSIEYTEAKGTGKQNSKEVGPLLEVVLKRAIAYGDAIATKITKKLPEPRPLPTHVFVNTRGKPWTMWGINSAMRYAGATFAFRQLRPKAETDGQGRNILGHTGQMRERYTRRRKLASVG